jgi:hypothetical protein
MSEGIVHAADVQKERERIERKALKRLPKNKMELLEALKKEAIIGKPEALALAYIVSELCPEDRTTKHVFRKREVEG